MPQHLKTKNDEHKNSQATTTRHDHRLLDFFKLKAMQSQEATQIQGYITFQNGSLVYSQTTPPAADVCWNSKNWVANGNLDQYIRFLNYAQFIQLPRTTNIKVIRRLYHNFAMHTLLRDNGIDMFPVDRPEASQRKFVLPYKLVNLILVNTKAVCNWFPRLRAVFKLKTAR